MSSISGDAKQTRVLLIPSSGMGHLNPFVRLAGALSARRVSVSILAVRPAVSAAESDLLSSLPSSLLLDFPLSPFDPSLFPAVSDPVLLRWEAIRRSAHLLPAFISALPPPAASSLIVDISLASSFLPFAAAASIPCFVYGVSSASMLALCSAFPFLPHPPADPIKIAGGVLKIPTFSLPAPLLNSGHLFTAQFVENGRALALASGILVNTFTALEAEVLAALNSGEVVPDLPPVIALGPLLPPPTKKQPSLPSQGLRWLDRQPDKSVIYVNFGSRAAMSKDQIRELGVGLEMSGCRFFWVVKTAKLDREEAAVEIEELLGEGYLKRTEDRGFVVREWVEQELVLVHRAVAGTLCHSGWNSVMEAAAAGVRVLAWPRGGDNRVIAALVPASGLGIWPEEWPWETEEGVVAAAEIAEKVREVMGDENLAKTAAELAGMANAAVRKGGSSDKSWEYLITRL